jgi:hypothetical protein
MPSLQLWLGVRLVEKHEGGGETLRVDTRVPFLSDRAFALQATWAHRDDPEGGSPLASRFFLGGGTLALGEDGAELAVTASFVREVSGEVSGSSEATAASESSGADRVLAVRVARQEGWWLARWGETAVKTLSPARDGLGELVVELTLRDSRGVLDPPAPLERP